MAAEAPLVASICSECGAPVEFELGALQVKCAHCDAGLVVDKGLRLVRLECPRCRGNFYYLDGSLCGTCPYCEARLLAISRERLLRYVVRPAASRPEGTDGASLHLLPFWHLSGLLYGWDIGSKIEVEESDDHQYREGTGRDPEPAITSIRKDSGPMKVFRGRVIDLTHPDPATLALGVASLRLRGAVFPLEPFAAAHESLGRVVPPTLDLPAVREQLLQRVLRKVQASDGLTHVECQRQDLVAETLSVFYYPFWVRREQQGFSVWDAVTGDVEQVAPPAADPAHGASTAFDELEIVELACAGCGQPLTAGNRASVLPCMTCGKFWHVGRRGLEPFTASWARPQLAGQQIVWLPFWRMDVQLSYRGRNATRVVDLRTVLGQLRPPGAGKMAAEGSPLGFFVPAFGALKAPRLDFAARDMTRAQPRLEAGEPATGEVYNCFFTPEDAQALAYATWIPLLPGVVVQGLRSLRVQAGSAALWYVPFDNRGRELVNMLTGIRYDWTAFRGVRH
jgi:LSD1 subclass zinc finger protein